VECCGKEGFSLKLSAHQPGYLPYPGTFAKIADCDVFVIFDDVQYERRGFTNRCQIKTKDGPQWLTVPVESKNHFSTKIKDVRIANHHWQRKHLRSIEIAYSKAPYFRDYYQGLADLLLDCEWSYLVDLCYNLTHWLCHCLDIDPPLDKASNYDLQGQKSDLVLDMCRQLDADEYIFGTNGRNYVDRESFENAGITPLFQTYRQQSYPQLHGDFVPNMSVIDMLFNCGPEAKDIILASHSVG